MALGEDEDWAGMAEAVELMQRRSPSGKDKTYHLIMSFTEEEAEQLQESDYRDFTERALDAIGLKGHQCITARHNDTGNPHVHLAINLLDEDGCIQQPFNDMYKLKKLREEICQEKGFQVLGQKEQGSPSLSDNQAKRETHGNERSFEQWMKEKDKTDFKEIIERASSWKEVQKNLGTHGVEMRKHGAGLVFSHTQETAFVKASSVSREYSLKKMEARLGAFQNLTKEERETLRKLKSDFNLSRKGEEAAYSNGLKLRYKEEMAELKSIREEKYGKLKEHWKKAQKEVRDHCRGKCEGLYRKGIKGDRAKTEKEVFRLQRDKELEKLHAEYLFEKGEVAHQYKRLTWKEYLIQSCEDEDNTFALGGLQEKNYKEVKENENAIHPKGSFSWYEDSVTPDGCVRMIKTNGNVAYVNRKSRELEFIDKGGHISVKKDQDEEALKRSLELAIAKYGENLKLTGSQEFQKRIKEVAEKQGMKVKWDHATSRSSASRSVGMER